MNALQSRVNITDKPRKKVSEPQPVSHVIWHTSKGINQMGDGGGWMDLPPLTFHGNNLW